MARIAYIRVSTQEQDTARAAMQAIGIKPNTWYRRVKELEEQSK